MPGMTSVEATRSCPWTWMRRPRRHRPQLHRQLMYLWCRVRKHRLAHVTPRAAVSLVRLICSSPCLLSTTQAYPLALLTCRGRWSALLCLLGHIIAWVVRLQSINGVAAWGGYTGLVVPSKVERWSMIKVAKRPRHVGGTRAEAMLWSRAHIVHNIEKVLLIAAH